jgi:hypothetical protein
MGGKVKLGPPPSSTANMVKLGPPLSSTVDMVKLGLSPSSSGRIFRASSSWRAMLVVVIDLISSDEDSDDVLSPPPSYRYEVESDDVLLPPSSSPEVAIRSLIIISVHCNLRAMSSLLTC